LQLKDKIGKCIHCNAVFPFHQEIANFHKREEKKEPIKRPEGIDLVHFQNELDITLDQPYPVVNVIGFFFFILFGFLTTLIYFKKGISIFIPGGFLLGSMYCLYNIFTREKNKIHLSIDEHNLTVKWRPKKRMKDRVIDVQEIDQIYLRTDQTKTVYSLYLILNGIEGQKHMPLLPSFGTSLSKARYLEQEIEKHLGITDRKVPESNVDV